MCVWGGGGGGGSDPAPFLSVFCIPLCFHIAIPNSVPSFGESRFSEAVTDPKFRTVFSEILDPENALPFCAVLDIILLHDSPPKMARVRGLPLRRSFGLPPPPPHLSGEYSSIFCIGDGGAAEALKPDPVSDP